MGPLDPIKIIIIKKCPKLLRIYGKHISTKFNYREFSEI